MNNYQVLVISQSQEDIRALRFALEQARDGPFTITAVKSLAAGLDQHAAKTPDAILVDLDLPDSHGIATFDALFAVGADIPIMILVNESEEPAAFEAVQRGAQGFLSKGYFANSLVPQALRNIIHRKAVESALYIERERSREILEAIGEAVLSTDLEYKVIYINPVAERMTGWSKQRAFGCPLVDVAPVIDAGRVPAWPLLLATIEHEQRIHGVTGMRLQRADGQETPLDVSIAAVLDRRGAQSGVVVVLHDAREAEAASYAKMTHFAQHDFLTNLPNRMMLNDRIGHEIAIARRHDTLLAVLFLDLDNFKHINDSLGHSVGDRLLQAVAELLRGHMRASDTVSRQGGDEFIIVSSHDKHRGGIAATVEKLLDELAQPHMIAGHQLHVSASIGISVYPQDGGDAETLVKNADAAMYHAKQSGRATYQFFDQRLNARAVERQLVEAQLRYALEQRQLLLYYQPRVAIDTGLITGAEALVRWSHPQRGLLLPEQFIPIAEDAGLIGAIGKWVLAAACRQVRLWQAAGLRPGTIAVNVSASEFRAQGFLQGVREAVEAGGFARGALELELTESVLMRDAEASNLTLAALKTMGVSLVVDDFGTGYSSLSYLSQFPIDVLKIDQSFVRGVTPDSDKANIISAVIGMGHSLHLRVVAEGVETREQCDFLRQQHCDEGQGFYFGVPQPAERFAALLGAP